MKVDLSDMTVEELRTLALGGYSPGSDTVGAAVAKLRIANVEGAANQARAGRYQAYTGLRDRRRREHLDAVNLKVNHQHMNKPNGERDYHLQEALNEAAAEFNVREPLLSFDDWSDKGEPETYTPGAAKRATSRVKALVPA